MNAVLEPALFFISDAEWSIPKHRDIFLSHLINNLKIVDRYKFAKIFWCDDYKTLIWNTPQIPPWRIDRDWSNQIVPVIYKLLNSNTQYIKLTLKTVCNSPGLQNRFLHNSSWNSFLTIIHELISLNDNFYLCLGLPIISNNVHNVNFNCDCHINQLVPELIIRPDDWYKHINIIYFHWPNKVEEISLFCEAILIYTKIYWNSKPILYDYQFTTQFLKDIINVATGRDEILYALSKKLILTKQESMRDGSLLDEYISQKKQYRFRVSSSRRIHYKFTKQGKIEFLRFYDEGHHDDGL